MSRRYPTRLLDAEESYDREAWKHQRDTRADEKGQGKVG